MNSGAIDAYLNEIGRIEAHLERIQEYIEDHGEVLPDDVNYGHVGSMKHIADTLADIHDIIDHTGEYAR